MNRTNCKAIALERIFETSSELLCRLDDISEEDMIDRLCELPVWTRLKLAYAAKRGLRIAAEYELDESLMPLHISELGQLSTLTLAEEDNLLTFLSWLRGIHVDNERVRHEWLSSLNGVAVRCGTTEASFVRSFFSLSNQRVFLELSGDRLTLSVAEREWGRVNVDFIGCITEKQPAMPLPGYAVSTEAEVRADGRLAFSMLIDTYFNSESDFVGRLLSDEGWQKIEFTCESVAIDTTCVDYVRRMNDCGTPKAEMVENVCRVLVNKCMLLGEEGLNPRERSLMPAVALIGGTSVLNDEAMPTWRCDEMVLDALNNRYAAENFIALIRESNCEELAKCVEKAARAGYDNADTEALRLAGLFTNLFNHCIADGSARPLLHRLCSEFSEASALNSGETVRVQAENAALERVRSNVVPVMESLGFSGNFPNFRRRRHKKMEYLSFILDPDSDYFRRGTIAFSASVAAAETNAEWLESCKSSAFRIEDTTALDCLAEAFGQSHYAELCGMEDGANAFITVSTDNGITVTADESPIIKDYIEQAERQFVSGAIPLSYRRRRKAFPGKGTALFRSMARFLPVAVMVMIALLAVYLFVGESAQLIGRDAALVWSAAIGAADDLLHSDIR